MEVNNMALANMCNAYRRLIRLKDIIVEDNYQRPLKEEQVKKIAEHFEPYYFDDIKVSDRGDGTFACIDGHHHMEAARRLFGEDAFVWCKVINGLTEQEESTHFTALNSMQKKLSFNDSLRARYASGEEKAAKYLNLLERAGVKYSFDSGAKGVLICHSRGMKMLDRYGEDTFVRAFKILSFTENSIYRYNNVFIAAIFLLLNEFKMVVIDDNKLCNSINAVTADKNVISYIRGGGEAHREAVTLASRICGEYNKRLGKRQRLPYEMLSALL